LEKVLRVHLLFPLRRDFGIVKSKNQCMKKETLWKKLRQPVFIAAVDVS